MTPRSFQNSPNRSAALLALLLVTAAPAAFAAEPMTAAAVPSTVSKDDRQFLQEAAQTGMLEVQAAAIASSRALAPATRAFASRMAMDQIANNKALQRLAANKGVILPVQLDGKGREVLAELQKKASKDFDKRYAEATRGGHHQAIELFKETASESKDVDIRAFASSTLPALQHHLDMAVQLAPI